MFSANRVIDIRISDFYGKMSPSHSFIIKRHEIFAKNLIYIEIYLVRTKQSFFIFGSQSYWFIKLVCWYIQFKIWWFKRYAQKWVDTWLEFWFFACLKCSLRLQDDFNPSASFIYKLLFLLFERTDCLIELA